MIKEECVIGQRVKITPKYSHSQQFKGLMGTIKELPLGFVVVEFDIPFLVDELEPVGEEAKEAVKE